MISDIMPIIQVANAMSPFIIMATLSLMGLIFSVDKKISKVSYSFFFSFLSFIIASIGVAINLLIKFEISNIDIGGGMLILGFIFGIIPLFAAAWDLREYF